MAEEAPGRWWSWTVSLGLHALLMFGMTSIVILEDEPPSSDGPINLYFSDQGGLSLHSESEVAYRGRSQWIPEYVHLLIGDDGNRPLMGPAEASCDFIDRCSLLCRCPGEGVPYCGDPCPRCRLPRSTTPW